MSKILSCALISCILGGTFLKASNHREVSEPHSTKTSSTQVEPNQLPDFDVFFDPFRNHVVPYLGPEVFGNGIQNPKMKEYWAADLKKFYKRNAEENNVDLRLINVYWNESNKIHLRQFNKFMESYAFGHFKIDVDRPETFLRIYFAENAKSIKHKLEDFKNLNVITQDRSSWALFFLESGLDRKAFEVEYKKIKKLMDSPSSFLNLADDFQVKLILGFARGGLHSAEAIEKFGEAIEVFSEKTFGDNNFPHCAKTRDGIHIMENLAQYGYHTLEQIKSISEFFTYAKKKFERPIIILDIANLGLYSSPELKDYLKSVRERGDEELSTPLLSATRNHREAIKKRCLRFCSQAY